MDGGNLIMIVPSRQAIGKLTEILVSKCADIGLGFRLISNRDEKGERCYTLKLDIQRLQDETIVTNGIKIFINRVDSTLLTDYKLDFEDKPGTQSGEFLLVESKIQQAKSHFAN